jgi:predicted nucleotidyltransferase
MDTELRSLIDKAAQLLRVAGARDVYLFGSAAKGTLRDDSDIDLAVSGLPAQRYFTALGEVGDLLRRPVDLVDLDRVTPFSEYLRGHGELQRV